MKKLNDMAKHLHSKMTEPKEAIASSSDDQSGDDAQMIKDTLRNKTCPDCHQKISALIDKHGIGKKSMPMQVSE